MLSSKHMKMFIASDHRGIALKDGLLTFLKKQGLEATDLTPTPNTDGSIDFPLVSHNLAKQVKQENANGILVCGSGIGVAIAANRFKGIRAATAHSLQEIAQAKEHNHVNVLCLGADELSIEKAQSFITTWLETKEDLAERRLRRLQQLDEYGS